MATDQRLDYATVLNAVRSWDARQRFSLVQDVLNTLVPAPEEPAGRSTFQRALGLLATEQPPPSDEDVKGIVDEERMRKYR